MPIKLILKDIIPEQLFTRNDYLKTENGILINKNNLFVEVGDYIIIDDGKNRSYKQVESIVYDLKDISYIRTKAKMEN